jgi:hypothetical protein
MSAGSIACGVAAAFFFISIASANMATIAMISKINGVVPEAERQS